MEPREIPLGWPDPGEEFHYFVDHLILVLAEECRQNRRFARVIGKKRDVIDRAAWHELDGVLRTEKEVLADCVTLERDRLAMVRALGESLGGRGPRRPRIAEIIGYATPEARDELLDLREEMRDIADELERFAGNGSFSRHISGNMRLYLREPAAGDAGDETPGCADVTSLASPARDDP